MSDPNRTRDTAGEVRREYEEFELEDDRLVVYDPSNSDAWLASETIADVDR